MNLNLHNVTSLTIRVRLFVFFFLLSSQSEREEFETEYKEKYERERILLTDENKKMSSELDKVKYLFRCRTKITMKTHTV